MAVGENMVFFVFCSLTPVFLLTVCGSLTGFFSIESFEGLFQKYPRYFEGVPLGYQKFVFDVSRYAARNMAKSEMIDLLKLEVMEYSYEVFLLGFATFAGAEIGVQGVQFVGKRVLMLRVVVTRIAKSQL